MKNPLRKVGMNKTIQQPAPFPQLIDLPVYRDTYCDQGTTDKILRYLWDTRPDLVKKFVENETISVPTSRDADYNHACHAIIRFALEGAKQGRWPELSWTGCVDLIYEMSRRVRKVFNLPQVPVFGEAIGPGPEGPFKPLPKRDIYGKNTGKADPNMTQEIADKLCEEFYQQEPQLSFACAEQQRRISYGSGLHLILQQAFAELIGDRYAVSAHNIKNEFQGRTRILCKIPSHEEVIKILESIES